MTKTKAWGLAAGSEMEGTPAAGRQAVLESPGTPCLAHRTASREHKSAPERVWPSAVKAMLHSNPGGPFCGTLSRKLQPSHGGPRATQPWASTRVLHSTAKLEVLSHTAKSWYALQSNFPSLTRSSSLLAFWICICPLGSGKQVSCAGNFWKSFTWIRHCVVFLSGHSLP